jgi:hypothetical protein
MSFDKANDNTGSGQTHGPDAHGEAAMLLVESLIHGLIARGVLTLADAVDIVDTAAEVTVDIAGDRGDAPAELKRSLLLLTAVSASLARDLPRG